MIGELAPLLPNEEVRENLAQYLGLQEGQAVAEAVSALKTIAEHSQAAAAEISSLSTSTVHAAEGAGRMLDGLVPDIERTAGLVAQISTACSFQERTSSCGR